MPEDIVRIVRILEYVGPRSLVEHNLRLREVKSSWKYGELTIKEAIVGDFPDVIGKEEEDKI